MSHMKMAASQVVDSQKGKVKRAKSKRFYLFVFASVLLYPSAYSWFKKRRPPEIARGLQRATELLGQATLNRLIETNPIAIINDQSLSFEFSSHNKFFRREER